MSNRHSVLVVGGSVAGAACALRLRQHDVNVVVAERSTFPRFKVCGCCIGGAGLSYLEELSLGGWAHSNGRPISCWRGSIGGRTIGLTLPGGIAISREMLDVKLLNSAARSGAEVHSPCNARIESCDEDGVTASLQTEGRSQTRHFSLVVMASGLGGGGLQSILPWTRPPAGPFGAAIVASCGSVEPGVIYMACDNDGYVGLVRLEDNRIDVAAALRSGSVAASSGSPIHRIESILRRSEFELGDLRFETAVVTTPPMRRSRRAGNGPVIAIGDAAGYIEPFTGEGMTWAMQSAIGAADLIASTIDAGEHFATIGGQWTKRLRQIQHRKMLTCRVISAGMAHSLSRGAIGFALSRWPGLAAPLIGSLNRAG